MSKSEEFYIKLKAQLEDTTTFPAKYLYKFIIPKDNDNLTKLEKMFDHKGAVINTKESRTGKYTSVSVLVNMKSADEVIEKYKEAGTIEGIISL